MIKITIDGDRVTVEPGTAKMETVSPFCKPSDMFKGGLYCHWAPEDVKTILYALGCMLQLSKTPETYGEAQAMITRIKEVYSHV